MIFLGLCSCSGVPSDAIVINEDAPIFPDYNGVTVPCNMTLPSFSLADTAKTVYTDFDIQKVEIGSDVVKYNVYAKRKSDSKWVVFNPVEIYISTDTIDSYLAYRLIEPGYRIWKEMGIYQRNLSTYDEYAIMTNAQTNGGCMNCHNFDNKNPEHMMFHLRSQMGGTYILDNGKIHKVTAKPADLGENLACYGTLVYPSWHPSGNYIAFSVNQTQQSFHSTNLNRIEVFDKKSDLVVYDVRKDALMTSPLVTREDKFETFPSFSPDGKSIYFCCADSVPMPEEYQNVHYSLCRIDFDPETGAFGEAVDTLYNARLYGKSVSFPRVSPDGRYLIFTLASYGNFSIWHKDADLYMIDLTDSNYKCENLTAINSDDVDSYHSWSSSGRWIVFSSRRMDGLYTRPFFTHFNADGTFTKPFVLPQKDSEYYMRLMKSFNIPEFVSGRVTVDMNQIPKN